VMEVLPGNKDVLAMIARRWPAACYERTADSVVVRARLAASSVAAAHLPWPADAARTGADAVPAGSPLTAVRPVPAPAAVLAGQPS